MYTSVSMGLCSINLVHVLLPDCMWGFKGKEIQIRDLLQVLTIFGRAGLNININLWFGV